jgi:hypothetical protein
MDRRDFITRVLPASVLTAISLPRVNLLAAPTISGGKAWGYIGVPYPTDALPGLSGQPSTIPLMPTLPNGAHYTAHDWYEGNADSYDPCTIATPTPPTVQTTNEYVVNKFASNASNSNAGGYGTVSEPRASLPPTSVFQTPGVKVFVYGDGTPRPTAYNVNRKVDYSDWTGSDIDGGGTAANPCWLIGIDEPRIDVREISLSGTHFIADSIVFDGSVYYSSTFNVVRSRYITVRNSALYGNNFNGMFDVSTDAIFTMFYNNEVAYDGYEGGTSGYGGSPFSGVDRHAVRPLYGSRYTWFVDCNIHSVSGDGMQAGNSANPNAQADSPHYVFFAGNHCHHCGENAIDNKNSYHVVISQCDFHDFQYNYNADGGTAVLISNNDEGPWTGYHWIIGCTVHDCANGIRDSSDQSGETNYIIGNVLYDISNAALVEQDSDQGNHEIVYWVNNTIHGCGRGYSRARQQSTYTSYMEGNLFHNITYSVFASAGGSGVYENVADGQVHVRNNLLYGNASDTPTTGWASWSNNIVGDSSSENPLLVNPSSLDFTLATGSPAINAIATESVAYQHFQSMYGEDIRYDYLGNYRGSTELNIGAVEGAGGSAVVIPPPSPPTLLAE